MAQYNFEGDYENVPEGQLKFIHQVIQEHGHENSKIVFEPVGKAGDNYVASVKRILVDGENGSLRLIAKLAPPIEFLRQTMNTEVLFRNEHILYTELLPKYLHLQKKAGVPEEELIKFPKCYGSSSEAPNEVIILEDLKPLGFTMLDRFEILPSDCIYAILKRFAAFHSLSFVLRQKEPATFDRYKSILSDMWATMIENEETKQYFLAVENDVLAVLDDPDHINVARHKISDAINQMKKIRKTDMDNKYSVIVQGDCWTNNVMFRFEDEKLADTILIDYQLSRNASPAYDLFYMILNCTDHETRKKHFNEWIDYYHEELEKSLSYHGLKVNFVYPRDRLDTDLMRYGRLMFGLCVFLANMLIRKPEDAAKVQELMKSEDVFDRPEEFGVGNLDVDSRNRFKNRISGIISTLQEFGLL
ncbi:uncharacterized protein LOC142980627 [Anticarsia gemmatalis]|uniref:uncharacterized protein LOC142980627 n=1 Tax=Anticarsia gemmatalis TaxID=129554 RepID=UPI003F7599DC